MNLSDVDVFKKLATTLSFTEVARQVGVSRSTISKKLSRLEGDLGVVLLNRTTRRVSLTEAGQIFDENTADIDQTLERAAALIRGTDQTPQGTVSVTVPTALGTVLLPALVSRFQPSWPEIMLDIQYEDQPEDLISRDVDLMILISKKLRDSSLIARRLVLTPRVLAASPRYVGDHGLPVEPADLKNHRCLGLGHGVKTGVTWRFSGEEKDEHVHLELSMTSNSLSALIAAACLHNGVIFVPAICIAHELERGELQIIPGFSCPDRYGVYAVYRHRNTTAKVKVLVEFIEKVLYEIEGVNRRTSLREQLNRAVGT